MTAKHDVIVIGSGAGGGSVAYKLANAGKRVLLIEKGAFLPRDESTLSVRQVFVDGVFKNHVAWLDSEGRDFVPSEFYNVGGKTKWYGATLFRFRPVEFEADPDHSLLGCPFGYDELAPYYDEATDLLKITTFKNEPELQALLDKITTVDPPGNWSRCRSGCPRRFSANPKKRSISTGSLRHPVTSRILSET
jgi:choline dehydrogenase-like flavoprotein